MARETGIEWTGSTWNPIRGCSIASPGCVNCYAAKVAARFSGPGQPYEGLAENTANGTPRWTGAVQLVVKHLADPLRWRKPDVVFANSMSDLFHPSFDARTQAAVVGIIALATHHRVQLLTKRADLMREFFSTTTLGVCLTAATGMLMEHHPDVFRRLERDPNSPLNDSSQLGWPIPNLMLGVSAENQEWWDRRVPELLATPARWRFVSAEPLLGPIDPGPLLKCCRCKGVGCHECGGGGFTTALHQVIGGGESGPRARPCHPDWARVLRDGTRNAGVAFFWKQWGEYVPAELLNDGRPEPWRMTPDGAESWALAEHTTAARAAGLPPVAFWHVGKAKAGSLLDGREWKEHPMGWLPDGWARR